MRSGVEPDVAAGEHLAGDVHVVVLNKHEVPVEAAVFAQMNDVLDVAFPFIVAWMGFAGENELNGARLIARESHDIVELLEHQGCALIGGEPPRETYGQRVRIKELVESDKVLCPALALDQEAAARELDQFAAESIAHGP